MIDGGSIKRHFSDIVSAYATKNQSDITLIDPFQLIDYRDRVIPDQVYPHFQLIMDNFKKQDEEDQMDIPNLEGPEETQELHQEDLLTGDQRVEKALAVDDPQGADKIIRDLMRKNPEHIEHPQDLRGTKRPKSFNKKKGDKNIKTSTPGYQEPIRISPDKVIIHPAIQDCNQDQQPEEIDSAMEMNISQDQGQFRPPSAIDPEMEISQDQTQYRPPSAIDPEMEISQDQTQYRPPSAIDPEIEINQDQTQYRPPSAIDPCLLYTSPSPRDGLLSPMPSSA